MKKLSSFIVMLFATLVLSGCSTLVPDPKLHNNLPQNTQPLIQGKVIVSAQMNPHLKRQISAEGIDELVAKTIQIAVKKANLFDENSQQSYKIDAQILQASQAMFGAGRFPGKMEIAYTVTDPNGKAIFQQTIYNEGRSDYWSFFALKRHQRSRIVTAAGNVNQFVEAFNKSMKPSSSKNAKKRK